MNRYVFFISSVALTLLAILSGCGPSPQITKPPEEIQPVVRHSRPIDLRLIPGSHKITVQWKVDGTEIVSGYDIFVADREPSAEQTAAFPSPIQPVNDQAYPGDTNPDDDVTEYSAEELQDGVKYYVWVRIVRPDGTLSEPSSVETTVCGPRGEFTLGERFKSKDDGFSLSQGKTVAADASSNDLYLFRKDGKLFLGSPSRLNGYLRTTRFKVLPISGNVAAMGDLIRREKAEPSEDKVVLTPGAWVWLVTADNYNALLKFESSDGANLRLSYMLCPLAGERAF